MHQRSSRARRLARPVVLATITAFALGAPPAVAQDALPSIQPGALSLVGLGDSIPGAMLCSHPCRSYVQVYGELAAEALGTPVHTTNLATNDGLSSFTLLGRISSSPSHQEALARADLITLQVGFNDWQGTCGFEGLAECLAAATDRVGSNVSAILDEIDTLRAGAPTVVRVVTSFDPFVGATQTPVWWGFDPAQREAFDDIFEAELTDFNARLCEVAAEHDAVCIDTRTRINGSGWDVEALPEPAEGALVIGGDDHLHLTGAGHELVAQAVADAGFAPLD